MVYSIARIFDAIDAAFGKHSPTCDYSLRVGDKITVGAITYTVREFDFAIPAQATAEELAACLTDAGADVEIVTHEWYEGLKRIEPRPSIVSKATQENGRQP